MNHASASKEKKKIQIPSLIIEWFRLEGTLKIIPAATGRDTSH